MSATSSTEKSQMGQSNNIKPPLPNYLKFAFGGLAGMSSTCVTQPLDLVKNRMQLSGVDGQVSEYKNSFQCIRAIVKNEGLFAIYNGLSAGLLRQATYTTARLGTYTWMYDQVSKSDQPPSFAIKALLGVGAGAAGAFIGTPAEVSLIRMCADGKLPVDQRRNYKNVFDSLYRICKEEGVLALWRGCMPTIVRAMVVNAAQLATYSQAKQSLLSSGYFRDNIHCHFWASMISGLATTLASMPVDIAKTRIQNMRYINGKPEYKGAMDVWLRLIRSEGLFALWKGFTPYYMRLGPHTVLTFVFLEQFNQAYYRFVQK